MCSDYGQLLVCQAVESLDMRIKYLDPNARLSTQPVANQSKWREIASLSVPLA